MHHLSGNGINKKTHRIRCRCVFLFLEVQRSFPFLHPTHLRRSISTFISTRHSSLVSLFFDGGQQLVLGGHYFIQFSLQLLIVGYSMFSEEIQRLGRLFQIVDFGPMCKASALLGFQVILNINEQVYLFIDSLWLSGWTGRSGNPGGNGLLCVIDAQRV